MVKRWTFHITAGALCLDFANTMSWRRSAAPIERIEDIGDLASWARQVGLISKRAEWTVQTQAGRQPASARARLAAARRLRETIFDVFAAQAERRQIPMRAFNRLSRAIHGAIRRSQLERVDRGFRWRVIKGDPIDDALAAVALSAEALLRSEAMSRVGECSGKDCRWLWIDRTKNLSRRWCDMAVCGNRSKARRHYLRTVGTRGPRAIRGRHAVR